MTTPSPPPDRPIRIANCSGFAGDRRSAAREMVDGLGSLDVLTGDWLAGLSMLNLARGQARRPDGGYASAFVATMEDVLGTCLDRGIRVVANAGGLDPAGCAAAVGELAARLGLAVTVAHVEGDDLRAAVPGLRAAGHPFTNRDTGEWLAPVGTDVLAANACLGGRGIADALARGADVVVTGRVAGAALVVGPAAWWHGWSWDRWNALAGAAAAGHVIERGAQATGGNYAFFEQVPDPLRPGFPIAEVAADGTAVITKHPGTAGLVSVGTVTAQLLDEIGGPSYATPDVVAHLDLIGVTQAGPDRVALDGAVGSPPAPDLQVDLHYLGGHRSSVTFVLTGLSLPAKAALAERSLWAALPGGREAFDTVDVHLSGAGLRAADPATGDDALAFLRITVTSTHPHRVGRVFSNAAAELARGSCPGCFAGAPAGPAAPFGVCWPTTMPRSAVPQRMVIGGESTDVAPPPQTAPLLADVESQVRGEPLASTVRVPLGRIVGARSGARGGDANVGLWVATDAAYDWLAVELTTARLRRLLPEAAHLEIRRYAFPNLLAVNFVIAGFLGRGAAACTRTDARATGLGEYLRARVVDVPVALLHP